MKFLIVLAVIALASPLYAQSEEKIIEKRGISLGLHGIGGGLGYGGGYSGYSSSLPVARISSGYSGYGGLSGGHGRILSSGHY